MHVPHGPGESFGDRHWTAGEYHGQVGGGSGAHIKIGVDPLPKTDRHKFCPSQFCPSERISA
jgi:hypothetical protein